MSKTEITNALVMNIKDSFSNMKNDDVLRIIKKVKEGNGGTFVGLSLNQAIDMAKAIIGEFCCILRLIF